MKSQSNKQSVELSVSLTLSKYFTDPKFVFTFDLISPLEVDFFFGLVFDNQEEEKLGKNCFFLAFLQPF